MMSTEELRLECLKLAYPSEWPTEEVIRRASALYDFVIGKDRAALAEEAKAAIDRAMS